MAPSWVRTFYKSKCDRIRKQAEETKETGEAEEASKDTPDLGKIVEMRQVLMDKATQAYQTIMCVYIKQILNEASPTDE